MTTLMPKDVAPAFTLPDADGAPVSLADFAGGPVIVYFYPSAMTPGCTIEAGDFEASRPELGAAGYRILGVSPDDPERLTRFRERDSLAFTLLSDPDHAVATSYGAFGTRVLYGRTVEGVLRSTFVIDVDEHGLGAVRLALYNVRANGHVQRLRQELGLAATVSAT